MFEESGIGWHQDGTDLAYEPSPYTKETNELNPRLKRDYMQLSFTYTFAKPYDEIFCAYTLPYTYSTLMAHLK